MKNIKTFHHFLNEMGQINKNVLNTGSKKPWDIVNNKAEQLFDEFGFATLTPQQMNKIIKLDQADKLADKMYGEFGFATLDEDDMEQLLNANPTLMR